MDLLSKFGLSILSPSDQVRYLDHDEGGSLRPALINDREKVFVLESYKSLETLTHENIMGIFYLMNVQVASFLKLKSLLIKENSIFLVYESAEYNLNTFMAERELKIELRFYILKQLVEIIYTMTLFNNDFTDFDLGFFFINEKETETSYVSVNKLPLLKIIYHGMTN